MSNLLVIKININYISLIVLQYSINAFYTYNIQVELISKQINCCEILL